MGTDAKLFSTKTKQHFYYDREYNIPCESLRKDGITKQQLLLILDVIQAICFTNDDVLISTKMVGDAEEWVKGLPDDDIIYSRHEHQEQYFTK